MKPLLIFAAVLIAAFPAFAAEKKDTPVDFSADEFTYNRDLNLVIARGNVTFVQNGTTLKADHVNYSTTDDVVIATGNVEIISPDGSTVHANYIKLEDDLKSGVIRQIRYVLADRSVLTAKDARHGANFTEFTDVAYSSCDFCEDGSRFWELKAERLTHDREKHDMSAYNATMTMEDVPFLYLPYFTYPDPTVKRRTGFLIPSIKSNKVMGMGVIVPYYWEINNQTDLTFSPWLAENGILWQGEFRRNFERGTTRWHGTMHESRYSFDGLFNWNFNDVWRFRSKVDYASDDTYLRRYSLRNDNDPWLTSRAGFDALTENTYFYLGGTYYKDMRADIDDGTIPHVLPKMKLAHNFDRFSNGSYFSAGASAASLQRKRRTDSTRVSVESGWHMPGITDWGLVYSVDALAIASGYKVRDYAYRENKTFDGDVGSFHAQTSLKTSYPFISDGAKFTQIFEPVVMGVVSPNSEVSERIPDEDSSEIDFDDTMLFAERRFTGFDRFEAGSHVDYGFKWTAYDRDGRTVSLLIGQSYRFSDRQYFPPDSGMSFKTSDIAGRLIFSPVDYFRVSYAFRMDNHSFELNRSDVTATVGNALLTASVSYINLKNRQGGLAYDSREEISYTLTSHLTRYWMTSFYQNIDLSPNGGLLETTWKARYEDECFAFEAGFSREYTRDRDYKDGVSFKVGIEFKPFGAFAS